VLKHRVPSVPVEDAGITERLASVRDRPPLRGDRHEQDVAIGEGRGRPAVEDGHVILEVLGLVGVVLARLQGVSLDLGICRQRRLQPGVALPHYKHSV